jgi:hypothetical protein
LITEPEGRLELVNRIIRIFDGPEQRRAMQLALKSLSEEKRQDRRE